MSKGYIEVSEHRMLENHSRPDGFMRICHDSIETNVKASKAATLISEHGAQFSHYVKSIRHGKVAVYIMDAEHERISLRLKNFSKRKLKKIKTMTKNGNK